MPLRAALKTAKCCMTTHKEQGNEEFRRENYLKAAALYTKGLKEDPGNAVLLRSHSVQLQLDWCLALFLIQLQSATSVLQIC